MTITDLPPLQVPAAGPFVKLNIFGLDDAGGPVGLPVLRSDSREGILLQLYKYQIEFLSDHPSVSEELLTAREVWLTLYCDGAVQRYAHGVIDTARRTWRGAGVRP